MKTFLWMLVVSVLAAGATQAFADEPIVTTASGKVRGVLRDNVEFFKGIPYAAPPVGRLRWQPPQDPPSWRGVRNASRFSEVCPQIQAGGGIFIGDEDCLYLNVFRPKGAKNLPVMVFIHGGAYALGSASESAGLLPRYDGSSLAENAGVIVVTINYRLGPLGFLAHPKLSATSGYGGSGNYGHMDQLQALRWVQQNIVEFGGDPKNVTLFGQSAGGGSVAALLTSPLSRGLFHRAIIQSGDFNTRKLEEAEKAGRALSRKLGTNDLERMRRLSARTIVEALPGGRSPTVAPPFYGSVVDGVVLPDFPLALLRRGEHQHLPVLVSNVEEEMSWLGEEFSSEIETEQDYIMAVHAHYGNDASVLLSLYPASQYRSPRHAYNAIATDGRFLAPAERMVKALKRSQSEFVGQLLFTFVSKDDVESYGATHGSDLALVFGTLWPNSAKEEAMVRRVQKAWGAFARGGSPGRLSCESHLLSKKRYEFWEAWSHR